MKTKYLFESKTVIFNLLVALAGVVAFFWTPASEWVQENAVLIMAIVGAANVILRRATKDAYAFFPILVATLCLALPSCAVLEGVDVDGKIYYVDKSGAKGGIDLVPGRKPAVWFRLPAFKKDAGGLKVDIKPIVIEPTK